jgi:hypothetical protein
MPIYIAVILIGIIVALVINFIPKKTDSSLEEDVVIPEPTPKEINLEISGEIEITPAETGPVNTDTPKMIAKSKKKPQHKKKPATKANA